MKRLFYGKLLYGKLSLAIALALISLVSYSTPAQTQPEFPPSVRFIPPLPPPGDAPSGRPRGGAARGQCPTVETQLTALVPSTQEAFFSGRTNRSISFPITHVWGLTTADHPTFWFYVPYPAPTSSALTIEFVLLDSADNYVYKTLLTASETLPGIVQVSLPATVALQVEQSYHWYFLVYCDAEQPVFTEGWIRRVAPVPTLTRQLAQATPQQQAALCAANGIWYEALTTLGELRRTAPEDRAIAADWSNLLQSVGLETIATQPLVPCCSPED